MTLQAKAVTPIKQNEDGNSKNRGVGERHECLLMGGV
jgi:hypothetical protein